MDPLTRLAASLLGTLSRKGRGETRGREPAITMAMTATGEARQRLGFGERFARAAAVFLDPRVLIILLLDASPRREFRLG